MLDPGWQATAGQGTTLVQWRNDPTFVDSIQTLLTDGGSIDVRVRCKDHQPSDGLGAHKLVLAAASPHFLKQQLLGKPKFVIVVVISRP